jgi:WD40 repeat protein
LYLAAAGRKADLQMPPPQNKAQALPLTERELGVLQAWIRQGAPVHVSHTAEETSWRSVPESFRTVFSLAISPDQRFVAAGRGNRIFVYDLLCECEVARLADPQLAELQSGGRPLYGPGVAQRDYVHALAFSPNGQWLASGGYREIKLWERQPPAPRATVQLAAGVRQLAISPRGDQVLLHLADGRLQLWRPETNGLATLESPVDEIWSGLAWSADGARVAAAARSGMLAAWTAVEGKLRGALRTGRGISTLIALQPEGDLIAAHDDHVIRCWSWPADGVESAQAPPVPIREWTGHAAPVAALRLLPGRRQLVSGDSGGNIRVWKLEEAELEREWTQPDAVTALAGSPDGRWIAAGGPSQRMRVWDEAGQLIAEQHGAAEIARDVHEKNDNLEAARRRAERLRALSAGAQNDVQDREELLAAARRRLAATASAEEDARGALKLAQTGAESSAAALARSPADAALRSAQAAATRKVDALHEMLSAAAESAASAKRALGLADEAVRQALVQRRRRQDAAEQSAGELRTAESAWRDALARQARPAPAVESLSLLASSQLLLSIGADQPAQAWSWPLLQPVDGVEFSQTAATALQTLPDGAVLIADSSGAVRIWDIAPRWTLRRVLGPRSEEVGVAPCDRVQALAFSPDGAQLACGGGEPSRSGELLIWDVASGALEREFQDAHSDAVLDVEYSRDGRLLASGGADKFARLFDVGSGRQLKAFEGHTDHVLGIALTADGGLLATAGADRMIKIWNVDGGEQLRTIDNYAKQVTAIDFVGTAECLISSSGDRHVKFHQARTGQNERSFVGAQDYVHVVVATPDQRLVIAGGEDGVVRVWEGRTGEQLATFAAPAPPVQAALPK